VQPLPIDLALVIDHSSSLSEKQLNDVKLAADHLVDLFDLTRHQISLISFAAHARLDQPLSNDPIALKAAIDALARSRGTDMGEAIKLTSQELRSERHHQDAAQVMIILSDGQTGEEAAKAQAASAKQLNIRIITIQLGDDEDGAELMRAIASVPQDFYSALTTAGLGPIYTQLALDISGCPAASGVLPSVTATPSVAEPTPSVIATPSIVEPTPSMIVAAP